MKRVRENDQMIVYALAHIMWQMIFWFLAQSVWEYTLALLFLLYTGIPLYWMVITWGAQDHG